MDNNAHRVEHEKCAIEVAGCEIGSGEGLSLELYLKFERDMTRLSLPMTRQVSTQLSRLQEEKGMSERQCCACIGVDNY